jgi:hypothetical protein
MCDHLKRAFSIFFLAFVDVNNFLITEKISVHIHSLPHTGKVYVLKCILYVGKLNHKECHLSYLRS